MPGHSSMARHRDLFPSQFSPPFNPLSLHLASDGRCGPMPLTPEQLPEHSNTRSCSQTHSILQLTFSLPCLSWVLWRHAVLYIYVRKYESGGLMWPFVFKTMLFIFCIFGVFVACVFAVKRAYVQVGSIKLKLGWNIVPVCSSMPKTDRHR